MRCPRGAGKQESLADYGCGLEPAPQAEHEARALFGFIAVLALPIHAHIRREARREEIMQAQARLRIRKPFRDVQYGHGLHSAISR